MRVDSLERKSGSQKIHYTMRYNSEKLNPLTASHAYGKNEDLVQAMNETNYWKQPKENAPHRIVGGANADGNLKI